MDQVWYLHADFTQREEPISDQILQQVTAAVRDFDLSPDYLKRVRTAVAGAVSEALRDSAGGPASVRIYVSRRDQTVQGQPRSWGFFLVGKHVAETSGDGQSPALIELFLYTEGDDA